MVKAKQRESGIELLKVFAIILIVIHHVNQTLGDENLHYIAADYLYPYSTVSSNIQSLILAWMTSFGAHGNLIFFICSAWFLLESKKINTRKLMHMISDIWVINVIVLSVLHFFGGGYAIYTSDIIKSVFPTIFATNWYLTCYMLFYLVHLMLNHIIYSLSQKELLIANVVALVLYYGLGYIKGDLFFVTNLILFIVVYFVIAYAKIYLKEFCASRKQNVILLLIGVAGTPVMILLTNLMGMHFLYLQDKLTYWGGNASPFVLLTVIALFNLMNRRKFTNNMVNKISSLSLLIYIIHENLLLRQYVRPQMWMYIHDKYGYEHVVLWVILQAMIIFLLAIIASVLYKKILQKFVYKISDKLYSILKSIFERVIMRLLEVR